MKEMAGSLRRQADILNNIAKRFGGEYAWIEKAGMHASEVAMILGESVRRMKLAADELENPGHTTIARDGTVSGSLSTLDDGEGMGG